jgi:hypothetical protein
MAKAAKIYFMDIGGPNLFGFVDPFPDLNDLFLPAYLGNAGGAARISSNSWGGSTGGAYTLYSYEADQFVWSHPDFYISFSNGNSGPAPGTVGTPATAKDITRAGRRTELSPTTSIARRAAAPGTDAQTDAQSRMAMTSAYGSRHQPTPPFRHFDGESTRSRRGHAHAPVLHGRLVSTSAAVPANDFSPSAASWGDGHQFGRHGADRVHGARPEHRLWTCGRTTCSTSQATRRLLMVDQTRGLRRGRRSDTRVRERRIHSAQGVLVLGDYPAIPLPPSSSSTISISR